MGFLFVCLFSFKGCYRGLPPTITWFVFSLRSKCRFTLLLGAPHLPAGEARQGTHSHADICGSVASGPSQAASE